MAGKNINFNKRYIVFLLSAIIFSCNNQSNNTELGTVVYDYIDFFNHIEGIKERDFLVKVKKDSFSNYQAYRIFCSASLLNKGEIPNKIDIYKSFKIAYFTDKLDKTKAKNTSIELKEKGFYNHSPLIIDSNYPEWVVIIDKISNKQINYKKSRYRPLKEIINELEK